MKYIALMFTALLAGISTTAIAHHSDPQHGLLGSIGHWLSEPDHLLLIGAGAILAFIVQRVLSRQ